MRVEVVVELEEEEEGAVEDGRLLGGKSGAGRQDRVGLLLAFSLVLALPLAHSAAESPPYLEDLEVRLAEPVQDKLDLEEEGVCPELGAPSALAAQKSAPLFRLEPPLRIRSHLRKME